MHTRLSHRAAFSNSAAHCRMWPADPKPGTVMKKEALDGMWVVFGNGKNVKTSCTLQNDFHWTSDTVSGLCLHHAHCLWLYAAVSPPLVLSICCPYHGMSFTTMVIVIAGRHLWAGLHPLHLSGGKNRLCLAPSSTDTCRSVMTLCYT